MTSKPCLRLDIILKEKLYYLLGLTNPPIGKVWFMSVFTDIAERYYSYILNDNYIDLLLIPDYLEIWATKWSLSEVRGSLFEVRDSSPYYQRVVDFIMRTSILIGASSANLEIDVALLSHIEPYKNRFDAALEENKDIFLDGGTLVKGVFEYSKYCLRVIKDVLMERGIAASRIDREIKLIIDTLEPFLECRTSITTEEKANKDFLKISFSQSTLDKIDTFFSENEEL